MAEWVKKRIQINAAYKRLISASRTYIEREGMKKYDPRKWKLKKAGVIISHRVDFKSKTVIRDKEGHFIVIKRSIHLEDIPVVSIYAASIRKPNYREQILANQKGVIESTTVSGEDFSIRTGKQDGGSRNSKWHCRMISLLSSGRVSLEKKLPPQRHLYSHVHHRIIHNSQ